MYLSHLIISSIVIHFQNIDYSLLRFGQLRANINCCIIGVRRSTLTSIIIIITRTYFPTMFISAIEPSFFSFCINISDSTIIVFPSFINRSLNNIFNFAIICTILRFKIRICRPFSSIFIIFKVSTQKFLFRITLCQRLSKFF